jgi:hypothetical protein
MPPLNLSTLTDLRVRSYLYRVLLAVGVLAAVPYGLITQQELGYWMLLLGEILGSGTATYNTPRPRPGTATYKGKG